MKPLTLVLLLCSLVVPAWADPSNQKTDVPPAVRYELIQSEISAKVTLKIDKQTGETYQLTKSSKGLAWDRVTKQKHKSDTQDVGTANYQVFTSGIQASMTFLLNVHSGATWQLAEDSNVGLFWAAIE